MLSPVDRTDVEIITWILDGLTSNQAARDEAGAYRHQRAIAFLIESWARTQPEHTVAAVDAFVAGASLAAVERPSRRAALLSSPADGFWWAGLSEAAFAMNERARREPAAEPWVQLGLFHLSNGDPAAAADAFRWAHDLAPDDRAATFFLAELADGRPQ
jgi:hypothetical protein